MSVSFSFILVESPSSGSGGAAASSSDSIAGGDTSLTDPHVGYGILRPFRRDRRADWLASGGAKLLESCLGQLLGTRASSEKFEGELPWRPEFGSKLYLLRHIRNVEVASEVARVYIQDSIGRWEPRIRIKKVDVERTSTPSGGVDSALLLRVHWDLKAEQSPGAGVIIPDATMLLRVV